MPTWLLNPKNIIMVALAALLIVIGGLFLWQRVAKVELESERDKLKAENIAKAEIIDQLQVNITQIKLNQDRQQKIEQATGKLREDVAGIREDILLGGEYENAVAADITQHFNSGGVLAEPSDSAKPLGVLPKTDTPSPSSTEVGKSP
jgi:hypothetical protein